MSPFSDLRYQTSELKKSNTVSKVEAKQGDFFSQVLLWTFWRSTETFRRKEHKESEVKTQSFCKNQWELDWESWNDAFYIYIYIIMIIIVIIFIVPL